MVRDFILVEDFCDFCPENVIAIILTTEDIDVLDVHLGDPRGEALKQQMKERTGKIVVPTGIFLDNTINFSRDILYMYNFYKKMEVK